MAITFVTQTEQDNAAGAASNAITIPSTTAGDCLIAIVAEAAASTAVSATFSSTSTTWVNPSGTAATDGPPPIDSVTGNNSWIAIGYALNIPAGLTSVTVTWGATSKANSVLIVQFRGVATASAVDSQKHGGGGVAGTTQTATTMVTTGTGSVIVSAVNAAATTATFASGSSTPTTGWNALTGGTNGTSHMAAEYNIGNAGNYATAWTLGASAVAGIVQIALLAAAAALIPVVGNYDTTDDLVEV